MWRSWDSSGIRGGSVMSELERAWTLMDRIDERVADRVEPTPHGEAIMTPRRFHVYDENFVRVRDAADATAEELAREAEAAQGRYPEIGHRRVNLRNAAIAQRLEPGFVQLGWQPERFVLMTWRRDPDRSAEARVREVDADALAGPWRDTGRSYGGGEQVVEQVAEHHRAIGEAIPTRYFAVESDGRVAAYCELYAWDGVGQVENVVTLPKFRRRGFARALVLHALGESRAGGNDLTFLVADADDWPYRLYERLGFEIAGRYARFLKKPLS
jgi:ribosomal protein S18 acetylase RimI-like enzyme